MSRRRIFRTLFLSVAVLFLIGATPVLWGRLLPGGVIMLPVIPERTDGSGISLMTWVRVQARCVRSQFTFLPPYPMLEVDAKCALEGADIPLPDVFLVTFDGNLTESERDAFLLRQRGEVAVGPNEIAVEGSAYPGFIRLRPRDAAYLGAKEEKDIVNDRYILEVAGSPIKILKCSTLFNSLEVEKITRSGCNTYSMRGNALYHLTISMTPGYRAEDLSRAISRFIEMSLE